MTSEMWKRRSEPVKPKPGPEPDAWCEGPVNPYDALDGFMVALIALLLIVFVITVATMKPDPRSPTPQEQLSDE